MRGKYYDDGKRRVLTTGGYVGVIIAIAVIAALIAITLLVYLPSTEPMDTLKPQVVGIKYDDNNGGNELGAGADINETYFTVTYSDGTSETVALGSMKHEGLDVTKSGEQKISVSYGGVEQIVTVTVKNVDCVLSYTASVGGRIQGTSKQVIKSGADADTIVAIPETGYEFAEWSDGYPYATRKDLAVNESKEYIAIFKKSKFRVIFFLFDGTVASEEDVVYGEKATKVPNLSDPRMNVYGHEFDGWSVSEEDYSNVIRDMNVYPQYTKKATDVKVTVSTDQFGNVMGKTDANECGYYAYELAAITATPHNSRTFDHWEILNSDGVYEHVMAKGEDSEKLILIGDNRVGVNFNSSISGDGAVSYKLSFECSEELAEIVINVSFAYETSSVTFINYQNSLASNREFYIDDIAHGKTLGDYFADESVIAGYNVEIDKDNTRVIKDENGNIVTDIAGNPKTEINPNFGLISPVGNYYGMEFIGWYMKGDETQTIVTTECKFLEPSTLIAKWERKVYKVLFADGEEIFGSATVIYQETIGSGGGVPAAIPVKDGYIFIAWVDMLTGEFVDDKTQITYKTEYGDDTNKEFIEKDTVRMVPNWRPKEHTLTVNVIGNGTVELVKKLGTQVMETVSVAGEYTISEEFKYTIIFKADENNVVGEYIWLYGNEQGEIVDNAEEIEFSLKETDDNTITVTFVPKTYYLNIINGDTSYNGWIYIDEELYDSQTITDREIVSGETISFRIVSPNASYGISNVKVKGMIDGQYYDDASIENIGGEGTEYFVSLGRCTSDVNITIEYYGIKYAVTVNAPNEEDGAIYATSLNSGIYEIPQDHAQINRNEYVHYLIESKEGQYISAVRINGIKYDLFSRSSSDVLFYDRVINAYEDENGNKPVSQVGFKLIDGKYYYTYGIVDIDGTEYMYCENADTEEVEIFYVKDRNNEVYEKTEFASNAAAFSTYTELKTHLAETLDVEAKKQSDLRVTSVKVMIKVVKNVNISASYSPITYTVGVENSKFGKSTVSKAKVDRGGSSEIKSVPITGYNVIGYKINGGEMVSVSTVNDNSPYTFTVDGIREDKTITIIYEEISYKIVFKNNTAELSSAYVSELNGTVEYKLDSTYEFEKEYATQGSFVLRADIGKYFTSIKIKVGTEFEREMPLSYNTTEYVYNNYNITAGVTVTVECGDIVPTFGNFSVTVSNDSGNVNANTRYGTDVTEVYVVAEYGYYLSNIRLTGMHNGNSRIIVIDNITADDYVITDTVGGTVIDGVLSADGYNEGMKIILSADAFDDEAVLLAKTDARKFTLTAEETENGMITVEGMLNGKIEYGSEITVVLEASDKYYISSFKVDGKEISFGSRNWNGLTYDGAVEQYTRGNYRFTACKDVTVSVTYKKYEYKVILDKASINGTTILSVGSTEVTAIEDGEFLNISMEADEGYHISELLINGNDVGYRPYSDVANNNTQSSFLYKGPTNSGVHGDVTILVKYDINRYTFNLDVINDSANFYGISGAGEVLIDGVKPENHMGIAHGDDFYIDVYPAVSTGYYLYEISITYKGYSDNKAVTRTLRYDDQLGLFTKLGGAVWFNRFMNGNSRDEKYQGVTADIENITIKFRREKYKLTIAQNSEEISGTVRINVTNPNNAVDDIKLFTKDTNDYTIHDIYYYRPTNGRIYVIKQGETEKTLTDIELIYDLDETVTDGESGHWRFGIFEDGKMKDLYYEHGLFYRLMLRPTTGYQMTEFAVNGDDRKSSVLANSYSASITRAVNIEVVYEILRFEVSIDISIFNASMNSVSNNDIGNWVTFIIKCDNEIIKEVNPTDKAVQGGNITLTLDYGTMFSIEMIPNYDGHGVYLDTLSVNGSQMGINGDRTKSQTFSREIKEKLTVRPAFYVMKYAVNLAINYPEAGIYNETVNSVSDAQNTAVQDRMEISWGNQAKIRILAGTGYYVDSIVITFIENGETVTRTIVYASFGNDYKEGTRTDADGKIVDWLVILKDQLDISRDEVRDLLTIGGIKCEYSVTINFRRNEYFLFYEIDKDEVSYVEDIHTYYNMENSNYPSTSVTSSSSPTPFRLTVHHYDELLVYIYPKDGYQIKDAVLILERGTYDPAVGFVPFENSDIVNPIFSLHEVDAESMARLFNFTESEKHIDSHSRIIIRFNIRRYDLNTSITRDDSSNQSAAKNDTAVNLSVLDENGRRLVLTETERQSDITYERDVNSNVSMIAEHHGTINYTFSMPIGYMVNGFIVNGFTKEELIEKGMLRARETRVLVKPTESDVNTYYTYYQYEYTILVSTALIGGASNNTMNDIINVSIVTGPIEYKVGIIIDETEYAFGTYQGKNGASDNSHITIYTTNRVRHYDSIIIEPSPFEGYEIGSNDVNIVPAFAYFGTEIFNLSEYNTDSVISQFTGITTRKTCTFNSSVTVNANAAEYYYDITTGQHKYTPRETTVYFVFYTRIKRFTQQIDTYSYFEVNGQYDGKPKVFNSKAADGDPDNVGTVSITIVDRENNVVESKTDGVLNGEYEYFSKVSVVATAKAGYALYGIYEYYGLDRDGKEVWIEVQSGTNGITYNIIDGQHILSYEINEIGKRRFKLDFKQRATITVYISNPYKYDLTMGQHVGYAELTAYTDVNKFDLETFEADKDLYLLQRKSIIADEIVVEKYEYEVYIGNIVKLAYEDKYTKSGYNDIEYYTCNLAEVAENLIGQETRDATGKFVVNAFNNAYIRNIKDTRCDDIKQEGFEVKCSIEFYAYTDAEARLYTEKKTIGAQEKTQSGSVYYNGAQGETVNNELYIYPPEDNNATFKTTTAAGQLMRVELFAEPNYIFHRLIAKQINFEESRKQGKVVYETSELKMLSLGRLQYSDDDVIQSFNNANQNYYKLIDYALEEAIVYDSLTDTETTVNHYIFYFWVCGDLNFEVEFYRTYKVSYGLYRTDYVVKYGEKDGVSPEGITINKDSVNDMVFGKDVVSDSGTTAVVSYGATFDISTIKPARNELYPYQFVGWYINGINLFKYLEQVMPEERDMSSTIQVNIQDMPSLLNNNKEVEELTIYAVFQPIIDVTVINEKYYDFDDHFNSWSMFDILVNTYEFKPKAEDEETGAPPAAGPTKTTIFDYDGRNLSQSADYIRSSKSYAFAEKSRAKDNWSDYMNSYNSGIIKNYSASVKEGYKLYSAYYDFTMLLENITNSNFLTDSWVTTDIELSISNRASDVQFSTWQYYNWNTGLWADIPYKYEDRSFGVSADGSYTTVDCTFEDYKFNTAGLYNSGMEYAISTTDKDNIIADRPLLIRANMYKEVTVILRQYTFDNDLHGEISEYELGLNIVIPEIVDWAEVDERYPERAIAQATTGKFEYGTEITINYNQDPKTAQIVLDNQQIRYRFLGWFMMYGESVLEEEQSAYYLYNSEYDKTNSEQYTIALTCVSDESRTTFNLRAYYVTQYKQTIYSYNISGGESDNYEGTLASGENQNDTPDVKFTGATAIGKNFRYVDKLSDGSNKINYEHFDDYAPSPTQMPFYYWINSTETEPYTRLNKDGEDYVITEKAHIYFVDAGLRYTLSVDTENENGKIVNGEKIYLTEDDIRNGAKGFYPGVDTLYQCYYYTESEDDKVFVNNADYSSYYNTGKGTYWDKDNQKCVTATDLTQRATRDISTIYNNEIAVNNATQSSGTKEYKTYLIKYVSTATLLFYNVVYKGGVTLYSELAKVVSGNEVIDKLTVWDENSTYGDWYKIENGKQVGYEANGEVVVKVTLKSVGNSGYTGNYKYAYAGMKNGEGIESAKLLYATDNSQAPLFCPREINDYSRWREVNMEDYMISNNNDNNDDFLLFGKDTSSGQNLNKISKINTTKTKYTTDSCGDAINGYQIWDKTQLRNIEVFYNSNAYSCQGIVEPKSFDMSNIYSINLPEELENHYFRTSFKLRKSIMLTKLNIDYAVGEPCGVNGADIVTWVALCTKGKGFDGDFNADGNYIGGVAADGINASGNYGMFGKTYDAKIANLVIDNIFFKGSNIMNFGAVAGESIDTEFSNIRFQKMTNYALCNNNQYKNSTSVGYGDSRIFIDIGTQANVGLLVGRAENCNIKDVSIYCNGYSIELAGGSCGALAGEVKGGLVNEVTFDGAYNWLIVGKTLTPTAKYAGGLIGYMHNGCVARGLTIKDTYTVIGDNATIGAGGFIGKMEGSNTLLRGVTLTGINNGNYRMVIDVMGGNISPSGYYIGYNGMYIIAKDEASVSSKDLLNDEYGKAGGVVGFIKDGAKFDNYYNKYYTIEGIIKAVGGTVGYVVGLNNGIVTGISLKTGQSSADRALLLVALKGEENSAMSYNIGGVVGANIDGIVNDCSVEGSNTPVSDSNTTWQNGHVYVFAKKGRKPLESNDVSYESIKLGATWSSWSDGLFEFLVPDDGAIHTSTTGYVFGFNIAMGGIVGFNTGAVFNSFVKKTRITLRALTDTTQDISRASILADNGEYSWGVESGLIVGYMNTDTKYARGWLDAIATFDSDKNSPWVWNQFSKTNEELSEKGEWKRVEDNYLLGRIQSCYSQNSVVAIVGSTYVAQGSEAYGNESAIAAIGIAGICGGTGENLNNEYAINTCKASGNKYIYKADASSGNGDGDYHLETIRDKKLGKDKFLQNTKNIFYNVELTMANLVAGINYVNTANYAIMCFEGSGFSHEITTGYNTVIADYSDSGKKQDLDRTRFRPTRYFNTNYNNEIYSIFPDSVSFTASSLDAANGTKLEIEDYTYGRTFMIINKPNQSSGGFVNGKIVKTDMTTGLPMYAGYSGIILNGTLRASSTPDVSFINEHGDIIAPRFSIYDELNGFYWNIYDRLVLGSGRDYEDPASIPSEYFVRGQ